MSFFECEFPRKIGFMGQTGGTTGGPGWSTIVNKGFSGFEQRNRNWANFRRKYQLDLFARPQAEYFSVYNFFINVGGMADSFRFFDATDFNIASAPTNPAVGDGVNKVFQLQNVYLVGSGANARTYIRTISKPIMSHVSATATNVGVFNYGGSAPITDFQGNILSDTVVMFLNGVSSPSLNNYTIDATTGLVSFATAPGAGVNVAGSCQFHVPVRFDNDDWPAQVEASDIRDANALISVNSISLLEVLIVAGQSQG